MNEKLVLFLMLSLTFTVVSDVSHTRDILMPPVQITLTKDFYIMYCSFTKYWHNCTVNKQCIFQSHFPQNLNCAKLNYTSYTTILIRRIIPQEQA